MQRVVPSHEYGQLDLFGPERIGLTAHLQAFSGEYSEAEAQHLVHSLRVLRYSSFAGANLVEAIGEFTGKVGNILQDGTVPVTNSVKLADLGIRAVRTIARFRGVPRDQLSKMYIYAGDLCQWLLDQPEVVPLRQRATAAVGMGAIYGFPADVVRSYHLIDDYLQQTAQQQTSGYYAVGSDDLLLREALIDLSLKGTSDRSIQLLRQNHALPEIAVAQDIGMPPNLTANTIDLAKIVFLCERRKHLAQRIVRHAVNDGIPISTADLRADIRPDFGAANQLFFSMLAPVCLQEA